MKTQPLEKELTQLCDLISVMHPKNQVYLQLDRTNTDWYLKCLIDGRETYVCEGKTVFEALSGVKTEVIAMYSVSWKLQESDLDGKKRLLYEAQCLLADTKSKLSDLTREVTAVTADRNVLQAEVQLLKKKLDKKERKHGRR